MNTHQIKLSYFEFLFAVFLEIHQLNKYQIMILEVGVGGRLDATNLIDTDVAIITSIGRDHQDLLGKRLDSILQEKMGIARKNKPLLTAFKSKYLKQVCQKLALKNEYLHTDYYDEISIKYGSSFQKINKFLALKAIDKLSLNLNLETREVAIFLENSSELPGRGEKLMLENRVFHFYGSHNLDGIRAWISSDISSKLEHAYDDVLISFSKRSWQDIEAIVRLWIAAHTAYPQKYKRLVFTFFDHLKAFKPTEIEWMQLESLLVQYSQSIKLLSNWKEYNRFPKINKKTNILIIGSFYFVSEVRSYYLPSET